MADPTGYSVPRNDAGVGSDPGSPPGMPRWVKVFGIVVGALVGLFVILQLTGIGGEHGPGMHGSGAEPRVGDHQAWHRSMAHPNLPPPPKSGASILIALS